MSRRVPLATILALDDLGLSRAEISRRTGYVPRTVSGILCAYGRKLNLKRGDGSQRLVRPKPGDAYDSPLASAERTRETLAWLYGDPDARIAANVPDVDAWNRLGVRT